MNIGKTFGCEAENYHFARRPYPAEIFDLFTAYVPPAKDVPVLDIGAGTGRGTRSLYERGYRVIGYDADSKMIDKARSLSGDQISYLLGEVKDLTKVFKPESFKLITAFASFHWFSQPEEVKAIHTLLKPGGYFAVVRSEGQDKNGLLKTCSRMIAEILNRTDKSNVRNDPGSVLKQGGFNIESTLSIPVTNEYTYEQAVANVKSHSMWTKLSQVEKLKVWPRIDEYVKKLFENGNLIEKTVCRCVLAIKV